MAQVVVNSKAIDQLGADMLRAKRELIRRLAKEGFDLLRDEVPYVFGNLQQGVQFPKVDIENLEALITVTAQSAAEGSRSAEVFNKRGEQTKTVTLRPRPAFNYAEAVARGRAAITPKTGKALLIPVPSVPIGKGYILAGGQIFVVRKSAKAVAANPFDERAAKALEGEAESIANAVLSKFV
jgi:hypothetical protein